LNLLFKRAQAYFVLVVAISLVSACSGGGSVPTNPSSALSSSGGTSAQSSSSRTAATSGKLTPHNGDAMAAPYDPLTSGYTPVHVDLHPVTVKSDPMFAVHLAAVARALARPSSGRLESHPMDTVSGDDTSGQAGYYINAVAAAGDGSIWAAQDAVASGGINLPGPTDSFGNFLYAPTTHGPNGNCIETTTDYWNNNGAGTNYDLMMWNFCTAQNGQAQETQIPMDATFFDDYVETYTNGDGRPQYQEEVYVDSSGTWHQLLYNNLEQQYVDVNDLSGTATNNGSAGWSIFETHFSANITCPALPTIGMSGLRTRVNGTWGYLNSSSTVSYSYTSSPADCFSTSSPPYYTMNYYAPDYAWTENDPSVPGTGAGASPAPVPTPVRTPGGPNCAKDPSLCA
jgi:hypothetical protein